MSLHQDPHTEFAPTKSSRAVAEQALSSRYAGVAAQRTTRAKSGALGKAFAREGIHRAFEPESPAALPAGLSKEDLLFGIFETVMGSWEDIMVAVAADATLSPLDRLASYVRRVVIGLLRQPEHVAVCQRHLADLAPNRQVWVQESFAAQAGFVHELLQAIRPEAADCDEPCAEPSRRLTRMLATLDPDELRRFDAPVHVVADHVAEFVVSIVLPRRSAAADPACLKAAGRSVVKHRAIPRRGGSS